MTDEHSISRRSILGSALALGAAGIVAGKDAHAQSAPPAHVHSDGRTCFDVHHHFLPPDYVSAVGVEAIGAPAGGKFPKWVPANSIDVMDQNGLATAMLSVSAPGIPLDDIPLIRKIARGCNEFAAQMATDHPGRFGSFATLPLPDIDACLAEIQYAMDVLHADGLSLHTNFRDKYLGDAMYTPIYEEMNRRKAVCFVHPDICSCGGNLVGGVPAAGIEFPHDTTRTIVSLIASGVLVRYPEIKFIFSHAGGTFPYIANRVAMLIPMFAPESREYLAQTMALTQKLYFDTALSANKTTLPALLSLVKPTQVLFGSDFPFAPAPLTKATVEGLHSIGLDTEVVKAIEYGNALRIFPRFAKG